MADALLRHEEEKGVHRLTMKHGPNALDRPLMDALRTELRHLAGAGSPAVILASAHPTLFCPGWDLKLLVGGSTGRCRDLSGGFQRPPPRSLLLPGAHGGGDRRPRGGRGVSVDHRV